MSVNHSFAYRYPSTYWNLFSLQDNYILIKDFNLEASFVRFILPLNSIYRKKFNRFIDIIQVWILEKSVNL